MSNVIDFQEYKEKREVENLLFDHLNTPRVHTQVHRDGYGSGLTSIEQQPSENYSLGG